MNIVKNAALIAMVLLPCVSSFAGVTPGSSASSSSSSSGRTTKGVPVILGPYRDLPPITVRAPPKATTEDPKVQRLADEILKPHTLIPVVDFVTRGGVQWGDVAICDWTATYMGGGGSGWTVGSTMKGCAKNGHEIDVSKDNIEPYRTFAQNIVGSGQMQTSTFVGTWPEDHPSPRLQGAKCRFSVVVKKIMKKVPKTPPPPTDRTIALNQALQTIQADLDTQHVKVIDEKIKNAVMSICDVNANDVANSVSWAKFGEQSLKAFSWNMIKENIATKEGIQARDVEKFLREICTIEYVNP